MSKVNDKQIKFQIDDFSCIKDKLIDCGAIFVGDSLEKTILYDFSDGRLSKEGIFIRTKSGLANVLTIKEKLAHENYDFFERDRSETEVESVVIIEAIFTKIGLTNKRIMEKYRMGWILDGIRIFIDELPFGIFMEIQGSAREISRAKKLLAINNRGITVTYWDLGKRIDCNKKNIKFNKNHISKILL